MKEMFSRILIERKPALVFPRNQVNKNIFVFSNVNIFRLSLKQLDGNRFILLCEFIS